MIEITSTGSADAAIGQEAAGIDRLARAVRDRDVMRVEDCARAVAVFVAEARASDTARLMGTLSHTAADLMMWMIEAEDAALIAQAVLEHRCAGMPEPSASVEALREDAAFWADSASQAELEAYVAAGLRRIERRDFLRAGRERLLVALFASLPDDRRRAFLARVDPRGVFTGKAA